MMLKYKRKTGWIVESKKEVAVVNLGGGEPVRIFRVRLSGPNGGQVVMVEAYRAKSFDRFSNLSLTPGDWANVFEPLRECVYGLLDAPVEGKSYRPHQAACVPKSAEN